MDRSAHVHGPPRGQERGGGGAGASACQIQIAYAIGVPEPVSVLVDTYGTGQADDEQIAAWAQEVFDLSPAGIVRHLKLKRPIYRQTTNYGHFGRELDDFFWEKTDKAAALARKARR